MLPSQEYGNAGNTGYYAGGPSNSIVFRDEASGAK